MRNNKKLRASNKKLREELAETEEQLAFRVVEVDHAMLMLDDERVAKEKAQAELARVQAKAQEEVDRIRAKAREEVNRIHAKAHEEVARIKGEAQAIIEKNRAEAQNVVDLAKGQVKTERARALAVTFTLKKAQRRTSNFLQLKAAHKVISQDNHSLHGMAESRIAP
jgi:hypothetical protein